MNESCTLDHQKQGHGGYGWECERCNNLHALALIHADITGTVPFLVVLERLLGALGETGEKAA